MTTKKSRKGEFILGIFFMVVSSFLFYYNYEGLARWLFLIFGVLILAKYLFAELFDLVSLFMGYSLKEDLQELKRK